MAILSLPKQVRQIISITKDNVIVRKCADNGVIIDTSQCQILSQVPFTFTFNSEKYALVKDLTLNLPADCKYILSTKLKPRKKQFEEGKIECVSWLKHPAIDNSTTDDIVKSWHNQFEYIKYGIVEPSEAKITVKPRLSPRFIAKSHGNRYLCGSKQVSRSTTGILFQFKVWTLLACGVKIGRSMPYDRIHISKSRRLAY